MSKLKILFKVSHNFSSVISETGIVYSFQSIDHKIYNFYKFVN